MFLKVSHTSFHLCVLFLPPFTFLFYSIIHLVHHSYNSFSTFLFFTHFPCPPSISSFLIFESFLFWTWSQYIYQTKKVYCITENLGRYVLKMCKKADVMVWSFNVNTKQFYSYFFMNSKPVNSINIYNLPNWCVCCKMCTSGRPSSLWSLISEAAAESWDGRRCWCPARSVQDPAPPGSQLSLVLCWDEPGLPEQNSKQRASVPCRKGIAW